MIDESTYLRKLEKIRAESWPKSVPTEIRYPLGERPLTDYLRHWSDIRSDLPAIIYYGREITYRELDRLSEGFANVLREIGVVKGDRVAVFLPNCPQFHIAFFGILKCGAVYVPISPLSKEYELSYQLGDTNAVVLITLDTLMPAVRAVRESSSLKVVFTTSLSHMLPRQPATTPPNAATAAAVQCPDALDFLSIVHAAPADRRGGADLDSIAAINYTGGTTGTSKGCIHTQRDMVFTGAAYWSVAMQGDDSMLSLTYFPEFWIAGENSALIFPVVIGRPFVLMTRWDPLGFLEMVSKYRVTHVALLVDNVVELMDHPRFGEFDLSSLRRVGVVSFVKKLTMGYRERWLALTGQTLVETSWGMTETHTSNTFTTGLQDDDYDLKAQPVFVGMPVPGTEFKICDFDTGAIVPLDSDGEIVVRTPAMFKGYWNKPDDTAAALRDGWLHTGDIGVIDSRGYLHYLGRRKEMLKVKGMSVFPAELEVLLGRHPAVVGSAVIGRVVEDKGQVPVAFVQLKPEYAGTVTANELAYWLREQVAAYKVPEIHIIEALPLTSTGKVKKTDLYGFLNAAGTASG